jgi:hypothetical protein
MCCCRYAPDQVCDVNERFPGLVEVPGGCSACLPCLRCLPCLPCSVGNMGSSETPCQCCCSASGPAAAPFPLLLQFGTRTARPSMLPTMACEHHAASWRCRIAVVRLLVPRICFASGISPCLQVSGSSWPQPPLLLSGCAGLAARPARLQPCVPALMPHTQAIGRRCLSISLRSG